GVMFTAEKPARSSVAGSAVRAAEAADAARAEIKPMVARKRSMTDLESTATEGEVHYSCAKSCVCQGGGASNFSLAAEIGIWESLAGLIRSAARSRRLVCSICST